MGPSRVARGEKIAFVRDAPTRVSGLTIHQILAPSAERFAPRVELYREKMARFSSGDVTAQAGSGFGSHRRKTGGAGAKNRRCRIRRQSSTASFRPVQLEPEQSRGDVVLAGALLMPLTEGAHPAVILVHGAGAAERQLYRVFADRFARQGIAALIWGHAKN